ncbi:YtxH domain-containing protein [Soonwooa sp.]|uniref:YtxH domain-containing protein n=1 Tax=Soonwooa sp. TaxID=1938592 RepID=UPI00289ACCF4|nr:YtxH domain-containing protein [Soonwooa sp.]
MGSKKNGLLALLGLGALAYWKYKKSTPEEQQAVKDKINTAKDNLTKFGNDLKSKANDALDQAKNKAGELKQDVENAAK